MQIYLNTYSLSPQNPPLRNQQLLNTFLHYRDLCQLLMEWKVDVLTDTEKRTLVVGGHIVTDLMGYMTTPREKQIAMLVKGVYDRYFKQNIPNSSVEFSLKRSFDRHDVGVSYSYEKTLPVISFDYDSVYCSDVVNGFVRACGASGAGKPAHVKNLYDANKKVENLLALQTFKACKDLSPKDCPMWNQTALTRYFDLIEHDKKHQKQQTHRRRKDPLIGELMMSQKNHEQRHRHKHPVMIIETNYIPKFTQLIGFCQRLLGIK